MTYNAMTGNELFLSTLSLRRATTNSTASCAATKISIHALLAESDIGTGCVALKTRDFYPRSPCGERPDLPQYPYILAEISIHALLAESDALLFVMLPAFNVFLSTLSLRRATAKVHKTVGHFCAEETHFMESALPSWQ